MACHANLHAGRVPHVIAHVFRDNLSEKVLIIMEWFGHATQSLEKVSRKTAHHFQTIFCGVTDSGGTPF